MRLHELISPILTKDGKLPPSFVDYMRKHMDTEYGSKHKNKIKQLPKAANLNLDLDKSDSSSNMTSTFTKKNALDILKSLSKKARGKEPIHTTKNGIEISVDAFGNDKSIKFNKPF